MKTQPWVNVALFENLGAGKKLEAILNGKGFEARTRDDKWMQLFLFLCRPRATFRVQVRQNNFKGALEFLETQPEAAAAVQRAIHCPSCGSLRVNYPQMTRKFFLPTVLLHLGIIFRIIDHEAYCEHCHHTWNLSKIKSPKLAEMPRPIH